MDETSPHKNIKEIGNISNTSFMNNQYMNIRVPSSTSFMNENIKKKRSMAKDQTC